MNDAENKLKEELENFFRKTFVPAERLSHEERLKKAFEPQNEEESEEQVENEWW